MSNGASISEIFSWNSPLSYFIAILLLICCVCVLSIIKIRRILTEQGIPYSYDIFGPNIRNILKWTSKHETKTGILMFLIVVTGAVMAITFKTKII